MFKIIALCGALVGGAAYGLYTQTDLLGGKCGGNGCPLASLKCCEGKDTATPSCCANPCPACTPVCDGCPDCEAGCSTCCDSAKAVAPAPRSASTCCSTTAVSAKSPCCATAPVSAKKASCCANPCPDCVKAACDACPTCADCCGGAAQAAVAGAFATTPRK